MKVWGIKAALVAVSAMLVGAAVPASAQQRVLGADLSYWNCGTSSTGISQNNWNTAYSTGNRKFVFLRATRGGTTGVDKTAGVPGGGSLRTLSQRYDDPRFVQNVNRATAAGMVAGPYHFGRPDVSGNTGTDEANHFIAMAGAWMRPGYLMPMYDLEAGDTLGGNTLAQFAIDFSARIYAVMRVRPCIYINGNYSSILQGATSARRNTLAQPASYTPSVVAPAYPMLWDAYYTTTLDIQTANPKDGYSGFYGPWDDYGVAQPWSFWQHSSTVSIPGFNAVDSTCDSDVSHGDIEYIRNYLVPAVWWNDSGGDWGTMANWNSGQTPVAPVTPPDQPTPYSTGPLPTPRLPGASGSGPTSGQYDTVILERPNANITVILSSGAYNIRKLYMREALNLIGGSLTINYNPTYRADNSAYVMHGGPISAQFSGPVILGGSASLSVHTLQVDATRTFTLAGGTLTFNTINLMPHSTTPARILLNGNVTFNPLANATATLANGSGSGISGYVDLGGGARTFNVGNGLAEVDLSVNVPINNGALIKSGLGTLRLNSANSYTGTTTLSAGQLLVNNTTGSGTGIGMVTVNGGTLSGTGTILGPVTINSGGTLAPGTASAMGTLTLNTPPAFNGTSFMRINRNGGLGLADKLVLTSGTLHYGGTLVVANTGAALTGGEVFTLFSAPYCSGAFAATNLPALGSGLNWYLGSLAANGTLKVNRQPLVSGLSVASGTGRLLQIPIASLLASATDADGDVLALAGFDPVTTNGITLSADSSYIYYLNNAAVLDRFSYTISDGHGGLATGQVQIDNTLPAAPLISSGPGSLTVTAGQDATFMVSATGTQPLSYQWRFDSAPLAGATANSYIRTNAQPADAGAYTVVVTNLYGAITSAPALLTVTAPPTPPHLDSATLLPGGQFQFQVTGSPGHYAIDATTNLVIWEELTNFTTTNDSFQFTDENTNLTFRVYRARLIQ